MLFLQVAGFQNQPNSCESAQRQHDHSSDADGRSSLTRATWEYPLLPASITPGCRDNESPGPGARGACGAGVRCGGRAEEPGNLHGWPAPDHEIQIRTECNQT